MEYITRVKHDANGNPCIDGKASDNSPVDVNVKYEKEVRFVLGVAIFTKLDGTVVGIRIPEFEYTKKTIIAERDWFKKEAKACEYVQDMQNSGAWIMNNWEGRLFENDTELNLPKGLGKKI